MQNFTKSEMLLNLQITNSHNLQAPKAGHSASDVVITSPEEGGLAVCDIKKRLVGMLMRP